MVATDSASSAPIPDFDVCVLGGALAGSATAWQLLQAQPDIRIAIIERTPRFKRRVGESTVEVSTWFLTRVLGLTDHLNQHHINKQGLRFMFFNDAADSVSTCSELGPRYMARLPGFQLDRAVLDEEMLARVVARGARLFRPATIRGYSRQPGGIQRVCFQPEGDAEQEISARWLVDATGVNAMVARREGWFERNDQHPIASVWSRWQGVTTLDSPELTAQHPEWAARVYGFRSTATNHLIGRGWWSWWFPLGNGDMSIGVVFDQREVELPAGSNVGERLRALLETHPVAREQLGGANCIPGDVHLRRNLAYRCTTQADDGVVLVGDAAGFLDPFYSPGLDWLSYSSTCAAKLIRESLGGADTAVRVAWHNEAFARSYTWWFEALYLDKYRYMGDFELMSLAFELDLGLYYLGVVSQPLRDGAKAYEHPSFGLKVSGPAHWLMSTYNRRLARMAESRQRRGTWGRANSGRHYAFNSYEMRPSLVRRLVVSLMKWAWLESCEGWRSWGRKPQLGPQAQAYPESAT